MNCALPWNKGVQVRYVSSLVSRVSETTSWPKKYIWECGMATPLDGPVVPEVKKIEARLVGSGSGSRPVTVPCSRSSQGAAAHPLARSRPMAACAEPVSMTQNFSIWRVNASMATNRSANTSSMTAHRGWTVTAWCLRNSPS